MLEFEQLKLRLIANEQEIHDLRDAIGYDRIVRDIEELELKQTAPGFGTILKTHRPSCKERAS